VPSPFNFFHTVKVDVYPLHEQLESGSVRLGTSLRAASSNSRTAGAAFLMEANAPPPHQAAFATEDAPFIACK
jgi:hypothetical protein